MNALGKTLAVFALGLSSAQVGTADIVFLSPSKDNTLYEVTTLLGPGGEYLSNAVGQHLFAGRTANSKGDSLRRGLIAFDVATAVPAAATINSVTLELAMTQTISGDHGVSLHRALADWGEGSSNAVVGGGGGGAPATTGDATWAHTFFDTLFWTTAGGDFLAAASATQTVGGLATYTWGSTAAMVADVQGWLDNPATNFGWVVVGDEASLGSAKRFGSRETPATGGVAGPRLVVDFNGALAAAPAIPTLSIGGILAMAVALALAALALRRRQRRV